MYEPIPGTSLLEKYGRNEITMGENWAEKIIGQVEKVIIGKREALELAVICLLSEGHLLIEDVPGVGKTTLARTLAQTLGCQFGRIQFTPDTLPSDVTGVSVYQMNSGTFRYMPGGIMNQIVLADEINGRRQRRRQVFWKRWRSVRSVWTELHIRCQSLLW